MIYPRKRFGQNFLVNEAILEKMVTVISPKPSDSLVEIGPGKGALTDFLVDKTQFLELIELDRDLVEFLNTKYSTLPGVTISSQDVLKTEWPCLFQKAKQKLRVVGNLPYNISTPLLIKLLRNANLFTDMHFLLQKEVAERLCAEVGSHQYGRLSVYTQFLSKPEILFLVEPSSFFPPPKVRSAFVRLRPLEKLKEEIAHLDFFSDLVKLAFSHRRKTLGNNLKSLVPPDMLSEIGINPMCRPQQITVNEFFKISELKPS